MAAISPYQDATATVNLALKLSKLSAAPANYVAVHTFVSVLRKRGQHMSNRGPNMCRAFTWEGVDNVGMVDTCALFLI